MPFEEDNILKLVSRIVQDEPPSPRLIRREIPKGLAQVILHCLEKERSSRPSNYAELKKKLLPYSSVSAPAAELPIRFVAGLIDSVILCVPVFIVSPFWHREVTQLSAIALETAWIDTLLTILYFGLLEGIWGASPGKRICGLQVLGPEKDVPELSRSLVRASLYSAIPSLVPLYLVSFLTGPVAQQTWYAVGGMVLRLLLFSTARRRNTNWPRGLESYSDGLTVARSPSRGRPESMRWAPRRKLDLTQRSKLCGKTRRRNWFLDSTKLIALCLAGAIWSVIRPHRGLHDRIAGTYLVPR